MKTKLELLAPAKNLESGTAAINCGADAVYIGANSFGARVSAANSLSDIAKLSEYAHKFNAKVYATVNTIFTDIQIDDVRSLMFNLYDVGVDAYIIQDLGILQLDIPKLPIFASTQTDNYKLERIKFLDSLGFKRIILARELSLEQIKIIKSEIKAELEFFVYGALCVSYSGRCYISQATKGRSANRGECSQLCRIKYDLYDSNRKFLQRNKYLLSLKDLNLSAYISDLIGAGISSFKIEGRLKDINYVKNVTAYFRKQIDNILEERTEFEKQSIGNIYLGFEPNLDKTFNRSSTNYFIEGRHNEITNINTPKSIGEEIGKIKAIKNNKLLIDLLSIEKIISNGDGLCFFDSNNELQGFLVNSSKGNEILIDKNLDLKINTIIYRNQDQKFENSLKSARTERKIPINLFVKINFNELSISIDNIFLKVYNLEESQVADSEQLMSNIQKQFSKTGHTIFEINKITYEQFEKPIFIPISKLNEIRRDFLAEYEQYLIGNYKRELVEIPSNIAKYFSESIDYQSNVSNSLSRELYQLSGVKLIEPAFELQSNFEGKVVMTTKHCLKFENGICPIHQMRDKSIKEPLWLEGGGHKYKLEFDCKNCEMKIIY